MDIEPGSIIASHYRVQRQLGRGGMGEVFAAQNVRTGRIVAVKLLRSDSKLKNNAVARFRREAMAAGAISSDYVTQVLDVEEDDEHGIVIVFELLDGESLIERLKRTGPMSFDELLPVVEQVWMGLADAHRAGVIHRDLKPSNVYLEKRPGGTIRVKILDFGISKLPKEMVPDHNNTLTEVGQNLGTFSFMPPEQIGKAKMVDHRADIYACTTLIFQALSGHLPYAARHILELIEKKTKHDPRSLGEVVTKPVDPRLEEFLKRGLHRDPDQRFQTAVEALVAWRDLKNPPASVVMPSSSEAATLAMPRPQIPSGQHDAPQSVRRPSAVSGFQVPRVNTDTTTESTGAGRTMAMPASHVSGEVPNATMMSGLSQSGMQPVPGQMQHAQAMGAGQQVPRRTPSGTMMPAMHAAPSVGDPSRARSGQTLHVHPQAGGMGQNPSTPPGSGISQGGALAQSGAHPGFSPAPSPQNSHQSGVHSFADAQMLNQHSSMSNPVATPIPHQVERNAIGTQVMDLRQTGRNRTAQMGQQHLAPSFSSRPPQGPPDLSAYDAGHDIATTIYRPPQGMKSRPLPSAASLDPTRRPDLRSSGRVPAARRSSVPFVVSMFVIALLGFAIVVTISWVQSGKLPWQ